MANITRIRKITLMGIPAEIWSVQERGAASLRTEYTRWTEDGKHWEFGEPTPMDNGGTYTPGGWVNHRAGDTVARTVRGNFSKGTGKVLMASHMLPEDAPTDVIISD